MCAAATATKGPAHTLSASKVCAHAALFTLCRVVDAQSSLLLDAVVQNQQRTVGRSSTELGATLQAIRRLTPPGAEKKPREHAEKQLLTELLRELKREVKKMPPRSLANCLFTITRLRAADKTLMSKAVQAVSGWCAASH
jgi:hypothetical protein